MWKRHIIIIIIMNKQQSKQQKCHAINIFSVIAFIYILEHKHNRKVSPFHETAVQHLYSQTTEMASLRKDSLSRCLIFMPLENRIILFHPIPSLVSYSHIVWRRICYLENLCIYFSRRVKGSTLILMFINNNHNNNIFISLSIKEKWYSLQPFSFNV